MNLKKKNRKIVHAPGLHFEGEGVGHGFVLHLRQLLQHVAKLWHELGNSGIEQ
jgi:hypothetical protein